MVDWTACEPRASQDWPAKLGASCSKSCPSRLRPCGTCHKPLPCDCDTKNVETECARPESLSLSSLAAKLVSKACGFPADALRQSCVCDSGTQCVDWDIHDEYRTQIENLLWNWQKQLPVCANETAENKAARQKNVMYLAKTLKYIPLDDNFDDNTRNEIISCLNRSTIWLPVPDSEQKSYKEQMAWDLLQQLKCLAHRFIVIRTIKDWVNMLPLYYKNLCKKNLIEDIVDRLEPIIANRPDDDEEYEEILRVEVIAILKGLPLIIRGDELDDFINVAVTSLMRIPKDYFLNFKKKMRTWLDEEDDLNDYPLSKNGKLFDNLCQKIFQLKTKGMEDENITNDIKEQMNIFLKATGVEDLDTRNRIIDSLLNKIYHDEMTLYLDDNEKLKQLILYEVDNFLNEASADLSPEEKEELRATLVEILLNNVEQITSEQPSDITTGDETDFMIDKLFERIREAYFATKSSKVLNKSVSQPKTKDKGIFHGRRNRGAIHDKINGEESKNKESNMNKSKATKTSPSNIKSSLQNQAEESLQSELSKMRQMYGLSKKSKNHYDSESITHKNDVDQSTMGKSRSSGTVSDRKYQHKLGKEKTKSSDISDTEKLLRGETTTLVRDSESEQKLSLPRKKSHKAESPVSEIFRPGSEKTRLMKRQENRPETLMAGGHKKGYSRELSSDEHILSPQDSNLSETYTDGRHTTTYSKFKDGIHNVKGDGEMKRSDKNRKGFDAISDTSSGEIRSGIDGVSRKRTGETLKGRDDISRKGGKTSRGIDSMSRTGSRPTAKHIDGRLVDSDSLLGSSRHVSPSASNKIDRVRSLGDQVKIHGGRMTGAKKSARLSPDLENKRKLIQAINQTFDKNPVKLPENKKNIIKNKIAEILLEDKSTGYRDISSKIRCVLSDETILNNDLIMYLTNKITDHIKGNNFLKVTNRFGRGKRIAFGLGINNNQNYFAYNTSKISGNVINTVIKRKNDNKAMNTTSSAGINIKSQLKNQIADLLHKYNVSFTQRNVQKTADSRIVSSKINQTVIKYNFQNFSSMYPEENVTHRSIGVNSEDNLDKFLDIVDSWVNLLPSDSTTHDCKENMVKNLLRDIMDGQRYIRLNPNVIESARDPSEYLTYQVSNKSNIQESQDSETQTTLRPNIKELMKKLKSKPPPPTTTEDEEKRYYERNAQEPEGPHVKPTIYDFIAQWYDNLPIDRNRIDKESLQNLKHDFIYKLIQKICELYLNPDIFYDEALYEEVLRDEIDLYLGQVKSILDASENETSSLIDELMEKIQELRIKKTHELEGQAYKQKIRDAISRTISSNIDMTDEVNFTSFDILRDAVTDAFINLNYTQGNEELYNKLTKRINNEINKFCNNYLERHPETPISSRKLNEKLYSALIHVNLPSDESMKPEVEFVRIKDIVTDWSKDIPLADASSRYQRQHNKNMSILAKRLHDLEKAEDLDVDMGEDMKKEIKKWLLRMPLQTGQDSNMERFTKDLMDRIRNTEFARRFRTSSRLTADVIANLPFEGTQPCPESCMQQIPSCSLTGDDRDHLDRIKRRAQVCKSKTAKHTCRDIAVGTCAGRGSQRDERPCGPMKSVPSVCPRALQTSDNSSCARRSPSYVMKSCSEKQICSGTSPVDSFTDLQPQVIIKEYYWDSPCSPTTTPKSPCDKPAPQECAYRQPLRGPPRGSTHCDGSRRTPLDRHKFPPQSPREPSPSRYRERVASIDPRDSSYRFKPVDKEWFPDDDFFLPGPRALFVSDDEYVFHREPDKIDDRMNCKCRERFISRVPRKRAKTYGRDTWQSCVNSISTPRYCAAQCPHPSYLYFRH